MSGIPNSVEWYYVGHYGRLGPLTEEQVRGLITDLVIERSTYVWVTGMADWAPAGNVPALVTMFPAMASSPPPFQPNMPPVQTYAAQPQGDVFHRMFNEPDYGTMPTVPSTMNPYARQDPAYQVSDKSRIAAGILQILIPGVGRMYLGHVAQGVMQLILSPCVIGAVWAWIDGILMLCGNVKFDGYGRRLQ
ncbi:MAG: DUF4339 domain-containing protein [Chthonomonas sp.]|nr:DUF4339 domain-containing protein [Chthonomonas sp.]